MKRVLRDAPIVAALALGWVTLWGDVTTGNVVAGLAIGTVLVVAFRFPATAGPESHVRPLRLLRLGAFFAWKLVEASVIVAWEVVTPHDRVTEGIIAVPLRGASDPLATLVANCVTLTPGTLTLEYRREPPVLYVHVLHLLDVEQVRADVLRLEALALRAFGRDEPAAGIEAEISAMTDRPGPGVSPEEKH